MALNDRVPPGEDDPQSFERFTRRLIGLARSHLDTRMRRKVDPEDVVQSAYKSFFLRYGDGALGAEHWDGLWGMLMVITLRKCAERVRYFRTQGRDLDRECAPAARDERWHEAIGQEPTPEQAAVLAETVEALLARLDGDDRKIVEMSLQGHSTQEICEQLGRAERSVRRIRERVRLQLEQQNNAARTEPD